jgi:hypothetical protein
VTIPPFSEDFGRGAVCIRYHNLRPLSSVPGRMA